MFLNRPTVFFENSTPEWLFIFDCTGIIPTRRSINDYSDLGDITEHFLVIRDELPKMCNKVDTVLNRGVYFESEFDKCFSP